MRLSCTYALSGATVYGFVQRTSDSFYYRPGTTDFNAGFVEANSRVLLAEDASFDGLYAATIVAGAEWTDDTYRAVYYVDSIGDINLIGETTFFSRTQQIVDDGEVYDFVRRTAGLAKENMYWDQMVYSGGNLTGGRMRLFATYPFDVTTDIPLATYTLIATYTGTNMNTWKLERQ